MLHQERKLTISYLVLIALFDFMGLGMVVTIFPSLLLNNSTGILSGTLTPGPRLTLLGIYLAIYPLGQFFGAAILGKLSDIHGRKKLMLMTLAGTFIGFSLSGLSIIINSAVLLLISRLLAGIFAGNVAIAQASMADISNEQTKSKNLILIQTVLGLAWVIGPALGGWLSAFSIAGLSGFVTPFFFMSFLLAVAICYTIFGYEETLPNPKIEKIQIFAGLRHIQEAYSHPKLRLAFAIWTVFVAGWWLFEAFLPTYLLNVFYFSPARIGTFLASMGATYAIFQYLVVQRVAKKVTPEAMVRNSLVLSALSVIAIVFVKNTVQLHIVITLFVTSMGFALPGLITSISNLASQEDQGQIMGSISSVQALSTVLMMMVGGYLDTADITVTVVGGGGLLLLSWAMFTMRFKRQLNRLTPQEMIEK
jgi:DHA1 family tetracycline resistance protein-like MFS transporter